MKTRFPALLCFLGSAHALLAATYTWGPSGGGGGGTWDSSTANWWTGSSVAWPGSGTSNVADFAATSGTVTLSGVITANGLIFDTGGYVLQSGSLSFNGTTPTIAANSGTTIISSVIASTAGNVGLTKSGAGTLVFSGANTYSGPTTVTAGVLRLDPGAAFNTWPLTIDNASFIIQRNAGSTLYRNPLTIRNGGVVDAKNSSANYNTLKSLSFENGGTLQRSGAVNVGGEFTMDSTTTTGVTVTGTIAATISADLGLTNVTGGICPFNVDDVATGTDLLVTGILSTGGGAVPTAGLTKNGAGTLTLAAANTFPGTITISAGALQIGNGGTTGSLSTSSTSVNTIVDNASLVFNRTNAVVQGTDFTAYGISGSGSLTMAGSGTLTLNAANTYTGATVISAGALQIGSSGTTGSLSTSSAITNNAKLIFNRTNSVIQGTDFSGSAISGTGSITMAGSGTLTLNTANTYSGSTTISAGALQLGDGGTTGSLSTSSAISISTGAKLIFNRSDSIVQGTDFSGSAISGAGSLVMAGSGTLVLNAANTYTGPTSVLGGVLRSDPGSAFNSASAFTVDNATFIIQRNVGSTLYKNLLTIRNGGVVDANNSIGNFNTLKSLTFENGGTLQRSGAVNGGGEFTLDESGSSVRVTGTVAATISADLGLGNLNGTIRTFNVDDVATGTDLLVTGVLANGGGGLSNGLTKIGAGTMTLAGANSYSGTTTVTEGALQFNAGGKLSGSSAIVNNSQVVFNGSTMTQGTDFGVISGSGAVTQISGYNYLNAANTYTGDTTLNLGTLLVSGTDLPGVSGPLGAGGKINFSGGGLLYYYETINADFSSRIAAGTSTAPVRLYLGANNVTFATPLNSNQSGGLTVDGLATLTLPGANTYTGATTIGSGTLQIGNGGTTGSLPTSSAIANNGVLVFNRSDTVVQGTDFSSAGISGSGSLVMLGSGTLTLNAANSYSGRTTISAGALQIGSGGATGSLSTSSTITNNGTLIINRSDSVVQGTDFSSAAISGSGSLVMAGSGTLVLNAANTYTGPTSVLGGVLRLDPGSSFNTSALTVDNARFIIQRNVGSTLFGNTLTIRNGGVVDANNSIGNFNTLKSLTFDSGGTLQRSGAVNVGGEFAMDSTTTTGVTVTGTIAATISADLGLTNVNGGICPFNVDDVATGTDLLVTGILSTGGGAVPTAGLTKNGAGTLTLAAANTFPGTITISAGALQIGNGGTTGSLSTSSTSVNTIVDNASLVFNRTNAVVQGTDFTAYGISGSGSLTMAGSGTLTLNAANTYTGATVISAGALQIGSSGTTGSLSTSSAITNNAKLIFNRTNSVIQGTDFSGSAISGTGSITMAGSGTLTLNTANTYSGSTTISAGALQLGDGGTTGSLSTSSAISISTGAKLIFNRSDSIVQGTDFSGSAISGAGSLVMAGSGTLVLNAANTYTGPTSVLGGVLRSDPGSAFNSASAFTVDNATFIIQRNVGSTLYKNLLTIRNGGVVDANNSIGNFNTLKSLTFENGGTLQRSGAVNGGGEFTLDESGSSVRVTGTVAATISADLGLGNLNGTIRTFNVDDVATGTDLLVTGVLANGGGGLSNGLTKIGAGTMTLTAASTYTGATTINGGALQLGNGGAGGSLYSLGAIINNGTLAFNRSNTVTQGADFGMAISGSGAIVQEGPGTTVLTGSNSHSGGTMLSGGTLKLGNANALGTGALTVNGGTLDLNSNSITVAELNGAGGTITSTGSGAMTLATTIASGTSTYAGNIANGSGAMALTKSGSGTLLLSGSLTMAGLNANGGVTQIQQSGSIGALSVAAGATVSLAANSNGNRTVLDISSLTMSGSTSSLNLTNNAMILRASGTSENSTNLAGVKAEVNAASNGLKWDGLGIGSTTALRRSAAGAYPGAGADGL